jgi:hypothetical protein
VDDPRYKYGLVRVSAEDSDWIPPDAGLVDHLFLLFGLVESLAPDFFADRVFAPLAPGDYNADGTVDLADYQLWQEKFGSTSHLAADGNGDGMVDAGDYTVWRDHLNATAAATATAVPEAATAILSLQILSITLGIGWRRRLTGSSHLRSFG